MMTLKHVLNIIVMLISFTLCIQSYSADNKMSFRVAANAFENTFHETDKKQLAHDYKIAEIGLTRYAEVGKTLAQTNLGLLYKRQHKYQQAVYWFKRAAEVKDVIGLQELGDAYFYGNGVKKDNDKAYHYFLKAAKQNDAIGMLYVGYLLMDTEGKIKQNLPKAIYWLKRSGQLGNMQAYYNLGILYLNYIGTSESSALGFQYILYAAKHGDLISQYAAGHIYAHDSATGADNAKAFYWLTIASNGGHKAAQKELKQLVKIMTPSQLAAGQALLRQRG